MICGDDTSNDGVNQARYTDFSNEFEQSVFKIPQKEEPRCFSEYLDNLSDEGNILELENLQMVDKINQSNICYWKNPRKMPKFVNEHYLLGDTIGKGSYGKVKDCVDIRTMKRYAMKIIHRMKIKKIPGGMKHVESEIRLMRMLSHDNIVELIDDFQEIEPERRCIVMEFCLGSIHDLQTNGIIESSNQFRCLPEWQTRSYFIQIVNGLEYLHNQGLIHKDMKPGNFMLTSHDCVKITDFGVSEKLEMFQFDSFISGGQTTPAIQPPELAIGAPNICGYKLDIYGTGVSLYFMLCGRVPFSNPNILLIFDEIAAGIYTIPDWVSVSASDLIRNMMLKDVNQRFDIKKIKNHIWYLNAGEKIGAKVDPKVYLSYCARDPSKENLYRLSTGILSDDRFSEPELPAIMPMTVSPRLRTYYNWPLTAAEENAEIEEEFVIGEDFVGRDTNTRQHNVTPFDGNLRSENDEVTGPSAGIRFFIHSDDRNDSNNKPVSDILDRSTNLTMSASLSHSVFSNQDYIDIDNVSRHTIPMSATTSSDITVTHSGKKSSHKSKFKFGHKLTNHCRQS